ncbi:caspase-7-like isoform X2 [Biomphalaria glabrata]|uniref:Caspase-7-like isoform X2 n=2 Tax=Biomphalaria glabrata TaxID=6526 RepID=A0A9W2ZNS9_BIOGL|nr:caspase-7-like isoform X2 [Biomphalaria glabrata]
MGSTQEGNSTAVVSQPMHHDDTDGFREKMKSTLKKISCTSSSSSEPFDFVDIRTALTTSVAQQKAQNVSPSLENDVYSFTHLKTGLAIIINNVHFNDPEHFETRTGSDFDVASLQNTFNNFGFEVQTHTDVTASRITWLLTQAAKEYDHAQADCLVCVVLTHGYESWVDKDCRKRFDLLFGVDGNSITSKAVVELFNDIHCPHLKGKPRLFFFQACRGSRLDDGQIIEVAYTPRGTGVLINSASSLLQYGTTYNSTGPINVSSKISRTKSDLPWSHVRKMPIDTAVLYKDSIVMYATPPGFPSWRREGSWFIQSLCQVLDSPRVGSGQVSLLNALTQVSGLVARNYETYSEEEPSLCKKKQQPVIYSSLVKDVFFKRKTTAFPKRIGTFV